MANLHNEVERNRVRCYTSEVRRPRAGVTLMRACLAGVLFVLITPAERVG
jgi:hypothetical protein